VTVEQMRARYEEIKQSWRSESGRELDESVHELARLADQAQAAPDEGTEALQTEIEDLIEGISRRVRLDRERG